MHRLAAPATKINGQPEDTKRVAVVRSPQMIKEGLLDIYRTVGVVGA